jgi:hypothetical protein
VLVYPDELPMTKMQRRLFQTGLINFRGKAPQELTDAEAQECLDLIARRTVKKQKCYTVGNPSGEWVVWQQDPLQWVAKCPNEKTADMICAALNK